MASTLATAIFTRPARPSAWNPAAWAGPYPWLTLREWQASATLHPLSRCLRGLLAPWLNAPTDLALWPPPSSCAHFRFPFLPGSLGRKSDDEAVDLVGKELAALRQTLDMPPGQISGLVRNGLLAAHGRRLRQLEDHLGTERLSVVIGRLMLEGNVAAGGLASTLAARGCS